MSKEYVIFSPFINMAHMNKGGQYILEKSRAEDILRQPGVRGEILGPAESPDKSPQTASEEKWDLDLSPEDYIERQKSRYESGQASDKVKSRYELALRLTSE